MQRSLPSLSLGNHLVRDTGTIWYCPSDSIRRLAFLLASIIVLGICRFRGERLALTLDEHALCAMLGCLFCLNYGLFYAASLTLTTGLISVVSTMVSGMRLGPLVLEATVGLQALLGGRIGVFGLIILFRVELLEFSWVSGVRSFATGLLGTIASVGNLVSATLPSVI